MAEPGGRTELAIGGLTRVFWKCLVIFAVTALAMSTILKGLWPAFGAGDTAWWILEFGAAYFIIFGVYALLASVLFRDWAVWTLEPENASPSYDREAEQSREPLKNALLPPER